LRGIKLEAFQNEVVSLLLLAEGGKEIDSCSYKICQLEFNQVSDIILSFPNTKSSVNFSVRLMWKEGFGPQKERPEIPPRNRISLAKRNVIGTGQLSTTPTSTPPESPNLRTKEKGKKYEKSDFEFGKELGKGAFSRVYYTTYKKTGDVYATKVISQKLLIENNQVKTVKMEKQVLSMMDHPNIIGLFCTYIDEDSLYFALEFAPGGDLFGYLTKYGPVSLASCKFYMAELITGLEYMHGLGILHRDLKPENLIFDKNMHLKITDFGTAKVTLPEGGGEINLEKTRVKGTFVGTAQYVSPELVNGEEITAMTDLWAVGCIIFQMLTGTHAFTGFSDYLIFQKIKARELEFPNNFPEDAKDLVDKFLQLHQQDRLGFGEGGYKKIKDHKFFANINWSALQTTKPPEMHDARWKLEVDSKESKVKPTQMTSSPSFTDDDEEERMMMKGSSMKPKVTQQGSQVKTLRNEKMTKEWFKFLLKDEYVVYTSPVLKRATFSFGPKKRQLVLTTYPRFIYIDTTGGEVKGAIPWSDDICIIPSTRDTKRFDVKTPGRVYDIEDATDTVDEWMEKLDKLKAALAQDAKNGLN
jgi:3-phosphoinositide dependent protein kinase-1